MFGLGGLLGRTLDGHHPKDRLALDLLGQRLRYKELCREIEYILKKKLKEKNVAFSTVTFRAKSIESCIEKMYRKGYSNAFEQIRDLAGVRIVYLYKSDLQKIETIVKEEFQVIEKDDTNSSDSNGSFGYADVKFYVKLGKKSQGARYDDIKDLQCEIQVRTVAQDAWSIISHHLVYKNESEIPQAYQADLNELVGVFRDADKRFDKIHEKTEKYKQEMENLQNRKETSFLEQSINLDNLIIFAENYLKHPHGRTVIDFEKEYLATLLEGLSRVGYQTLQELYEPVNKCSAIIKEWHDTEKSPHYIGVDLEIALAFTNTSYRENLPEGDVLDFVNGRLGTGTN